MADIRHSCLHSLECVPCLETEFKSNLFKYGTVAFLPLTIFYLGAVMIKCALVCQLVSVPSMQQHTYIKISAEMI